MENRKNAVGIAFSGGGLQGIAHVGAIEALNEIGISPQYVSGTSSGSMVAALVAMGLTTDEMRNFAAENWKKLSEIKIGSIIKLFAKFTLNKKLAINGLKSSAIISDIMKKPLEERNFKSFSDLPINLSICTVDMTTTDECVFTTYDEHLQNDHIHYITGASVDTAVSASMAFPGIYTSVPYGEYDFIDGGSKDNLPVKILKDMGVGKVLALGFDISKYKKDVGLAGVFKVVLRALDVYSINSTRDSMKAADLAVEIVNDSAELFSIDNMDRTIEDGYNAVMKNRDKILRIFD